jgi:PAS domain S-box-containing protein
VSVDGIARPTAAPALVRYGYAVLVVGVALAATEALRSFDLEGFMFVIAVPVAVWLGGRGPGVLAVVLSVLVLHYVFLAPADTGAILPTYAYFVVFSVLCVIVTVLSESRHRAEVSLVRARDELDLKVRERTIELERSNARLLDEVAERKRAEEAVHASERELRLLVDTFPGMVSVANAAGAHEYSNRRVTEFLGTELRDVGYRHHLHPDDLMMVGDAWLRCTKASTPMDLTYRLRRHDGVHRWVRSRVEPLRDQHGRVVRWYALMVDVDDEKKAQEALRASQTELAHVTRVTTLGEVTATLAHEVNQPLAAIANNANACLGLLPSDARELDEVREALGDIVSDAERASAVVQRVRKLARRSVSERAPVELACIVAEVVALATNESAARGVTIRTEVPTDLPVVAGDRVELQQVLLNLVVNGMDAVNGANGVDRVLEIRGWHEVHDGRRTAAISVRDRGVGLEDVELERLFEPFYTTKPQGMGMGLAIGRSIIEAHGGRLWAEANDGPGATFTFSLPAADDA